MKPALVTLVLVGAFQSCHGASGDGRPLQLRAPVTATPSNRKVHAGPSCDEARTLESSRWDELPYARSVFRCVEFEHGAWIVRIAKNIAPTSDGSDIARCAVIALFATERVVESAPIVDPVRRPSYCGGTNDGGGGLMLGIDAIELGSPLGGDVPSILVSTSEVGQEGGNHSAWSTIYIAKGATLTTFEIPSAGELGAPSDYDGDGRLDYPCSAGIRLWTTPAAADCIFRADWEPAEFLAHATGDATFALDDEVAKRFARRWCPELPKTIGGVRDALCAKLWSTPATLAEIRRSVVACRQVDCGRRDRSGNTVVRAGEQWDCPERLKAFDSDVPFHLP